MEIFIDVHEDADSPPEEEGQEERAAVMAAYLTYPFTKAGGEGQRRRSKLVGFQVIPVKPHIQEEPWAGRYLFNMRAFLTPFLHGQWH